VKELYDEIRQQWVAATPEEMVRQRLIQKMVKGLGFPKDLMVVEKELATLPHLARVSHLPLRRVDLLCFAYAKRGDIFPLLLVECKTELLSRVVLEQALAYNAFVKASFVAIVNESKVILKGEHCEIDYLPPFPELVKVVCG
jgi:hypothetical protein